MQRAPSGSAPPRGSADSEEARGRPSLQLISTRLQLEGPQGRGPRLPVAKFLKGNQIPAKPMHTGGKTLPIPPASVQIAPCTGVISSTVRCIVDSCMRLIVIISDVLTRSERVKTADRHARTASNDTDRLHPCLVDAL